MNATSRAWSFSLNRRASDARSTSLFEKPGPVRDVYLIHVVTFVALNRQPTICLSPWRRSQIGKEPGESYAVLRAFTSLLSRVLQRGERISPKPNALTLAIYSKRKANPLYHL
ncbi:hypothetical protein VNO77_19778 [Canavalia gladiata]|uniref:Uncharacterized protein n=1 Tax=Canavalia gladiata TaxID=3824 RepID=A0AAN9LN88_CANGL